MSAKPQYYRMSPIFGGINSMAEEGTLTFFADKQNVIPAEFRDMENFQPSRRGGLSKTKGFSVFRDIGSDPVTGITRYKNSSGTNQLIASSGTDLYTVTDSSHTSFYSSLTSNAYTDFETAQDELVICDGTISPVRYDGVSVTAIGGSPPAGAKQSLYYQNRLWMFSATNNQSLLYYSDASDINAGYSSNFVNCDTNDGQNITAIAKYFIPGQIEPVILVGKERSIGIITGDGSGSNPYTFIKINQDAGIPGFRQIVQFGSDVAYFTPKGVSSFKTDVREVNLLYAFLSEKVRNKFQDLSTNSLGIAHAWHDWKNSRISFAVVEQGYSYPNVIWHYDTTFKAWYKERWGAIKYNLCSFIDEDGTWYHGDEAGNVFVHDTTDSFNSSAINAFFVTDYLDFGNPLTRKRIVINQMEVLGNGAYSAQIACSTNRQSRITSTHTITLNAGQYLWGGGVWTDDPDVYQWGGSVVQKRRWIPSGFFEDIRYQVTQANADQPLDILSFDFLVETGEFR